MSSLATLEVLVVDCQATFAGARGQLLELGWGRAGPELGTPCSRLIRLPPGERIPPAVARITGLTEQLVRTGVTPSQAWTELKAEAAALTLQPAPTVAHFARYEQPFLERLAGGAPPLDVVCTHEIARRLFPELPRRSLRALAGYFGRAVTSLRRSAEHVAATAFVWRELVRLLDGEGVRAWAELHEWLAVPVDPKRRARHAWPMPRALRLALPDEPGLYRMLRTSGDVLYVGKATSLHHRVNSYFRKQHGVHERTLEMLSQARGLSFEVTHSPLEAALLEPDEIKRHRPPYNVALTEKDREIWFVSPDFSERSPRPTERCGVGPFPSGELLEQLDAFARGSESSLGRGRWAPAAEVFASGLARAVATHAELRRHAVCDILRLGARLWREGRRDRDDAPEADELVSRPEWTPELVASSLERLAVRGALALRRARWLTRLVESALVWTEKGVAGARVLVIEGGDFALRDAAAPGQAPPEPVGHARTREDRHAGFTVARLDRLRVLTTELKRLVSEGHAVALRLGPHALYVNPRRDDARPLARVLEWL